MPLWERRPVRVERRRRRGRGGGTRGRGCACGEPSRAPSPRAGPGGPEHGCIRVAIMNKSNKQRTTTSEQPHATACSSEATLPRYPLNAKICSPPRSALTCLHPIATHPRPQPDPRTEPKPATTPEWSSRQPVSATQRGDSPQPLNTRRAAELAPAPLIEALSPAFPSRVIARPHLCGTAITARCTAGASFAVTVSSSSSAP